MIKFKVYFWKYLPKGYFKEIKSKYKDRLGDYMNVYICDTFEEMYNLADKMEKTKLERNYAARTLCFTRNFYEYATGKYIKTGPLCGYIYFNQENFYMDAITHECSHAVIGYFGRKLKDCQDFFVKTDEYGCLLDCPENEYIESEDKEELFCYMLGNIADQIACKSK